LKYFLAISHFAGELFYPMLTGSIGKLFHFFPLLCPKALDIDRVRTCHEYLKELYPAFELQRRLNLLICRGLEDLKKYKGERLLYVLLILLHRKLIDKGTSDLLFSLIQKYRKQVNSEKTLRVKSPETIVGLSDDQCQALSERKKGSGSIAASVVKKAYQTMP